MKTYKKFIEDIQESSLSRIKSKSDKGGMKTQCLHLEEGDNLSRKKNQRKITTIR